MFEDIPRCRPYLRPFHEIPLDNHLCVEEFGETKISKLSNHVEDNTTKEGVDKQFQPFDIKLEKTMKTKIFQVWMKILQTRTC